MDLLIKDYISLQDYKKLRLSVGFHDLSDRQLKNSLSNCEKLFVVYNSDIPAGMVRLTYDKGYAFCLYDVIVSPEHQLKGIGKYMLECVFDYIKSITHENEQYLISLMAAKNKEEFYSKFGFITRPDEQYGAGMSMWYKK